MRTQILSIGLAIAALTACESTDVVKNDQAATAQRAQVAPTAEPKKALSAEALANMVQTQEDFELEAVEQITDENLEVELAKLELEVSAD